MLGYNFNVDGHTLRLVIMRFRAVSSPISAAQWRNNAGHEVYVDTAPMKVRA